MKALALLIGSIGRLFGKTSGWSKQTVRNVRSVPYANILPGVDMQSMKPTTDTLVNAAEVQIESATHAFPRKTPRRSFEVEPLLTADDVAKRLNVSTDWVWDHSSRKKPLLPVIRMGDGTLRYRASNIEAFIDEQERMTTLRRRAS
jgi:hypothetical protein